MMMRVSTDTMTVENIVVESTLVGDSCRVCDKTLEESDFTACIVDGKNILAVFCEDNGCASTFREKRESGDVEEWLEEVSGE